VFVIGPEFMSTYKLAHALATVEKVTLTTQSISHASNVTCKAVKSLPRSSGCVKKVAKQLALPPNQNG
jgi:FMN-dependent NADH-azoreductase